MQHSSYIFRHFFADYSTKGHFIPIYFVLLQQVEIVELVNQIMYSKKCNSSADTSALESEIDSLLYQLYGLTEEEIKIVEQS